MWTILQLTVQEASIVNKMKKATFELFGPSSEMFQQDIQHDCYHSLPRSTAAHNSCFWKEPQDPWVCAQSASAVSWMLLPHNSCLHAAALLKVGEKKAPFALYHPPQHCIFKAVHLKSISFLHQSKVKNALANLRGFRSPQSMQPTTSWKNGH